MASAHYAQLLVVADYQTSSDEYPQRASGVVGSGRRWSEFQSPGPANPSAPSEVASVSPQAFSRQCRDHQAEIRPQLHKVRSPGFMLPVTQFLRHHETLTPWFLRTYALRSRSRPRRTQLKIKEVPLRAQGGRNPRPFLTQTGNAKPITHNLRRRNIFRTACPRQESRMLSEDSRRYRPAQACRANRTRTVPGVPGHPRSRSHMLHAIAIHAV